MLPAGEKDPLDEVLQAGILELKVAVHDRHLLPRWMVLPVGSVYKKPLYDADDSPEPKRGVVTLDLRTHRLSAGVEALFDLLSAQTRFDLIVTFD